MTGWRLAADVVAVLAWGRVLLAVAERPASRYRARWAGKAAAGVVALVGVSVWFGLMVPWGAALVWWKVVVAGRDPFELPMADGRRMR